MYPNPKLNTTQKQSNQDTHAEQYQPGKYTERKISLKVLSSILKNV